MIIHVFKCHYHEFSLPSNVLFGYYWRLPKGATGDYHKNRCSRLQHSVVATATLASCLVKEAPGA